MKPKNYWTFEKCQEEALKYTRTVDFKSYSNSAYHKAFKNKWLSDICSHMIKSRNENNYWTFERCLEKALLYNSKSKFNNECRYVYLVASKNGWLSEICSHMTVKPIMTYDYCKIEALKHLTVCSLRTKAKNVYNKIHEFKWLDLLTHLNKENTKKDRMIYVYEFEDNSVYVGLTYSPKDRKNDHKNDVNSSVFKHKKEFVYKVLSDFVDEPLSQYLEEFYVNVYKSDCWIILNKVKTGSLGGSPTKWKTKEMCHIEALKYSTRSEFIKKSKGAYRRAYNEKWIDDICSHMIKKTKGAYYWTYEKCLEEALKYTTRKDFKTLSGGSYNAARRNDWISDICKHMEETVKPNNYWTFERCKESASLFLHKSDFSNQCPSAYDKAHENGWLLEICSHMIYKSKSYW